MKRNPNSLFSEDELKILNDALKIIKTHKDDYNNRKDIRMWYGDWKWVARVFRDAQEALEEIKGFAYPPDTKNEGNDKL